MKPRLFIHFHSAAVSSEFLWVGRWVRTPTPPEMSGEIEKRVVFSDNIYINKKVIGNESINI
jgi:hypothetical protein